MEVFEKILMSYGGFILNRIRDIFQENEAYEQCAEINKVLNKYGVSTTMTAEDWIAEMWRNGMSGAVAIANSPFYFIEAIKMCEEQGLFNKLNNIK